LIELLKDKNNSIALIGASTNKNKFGYKILIDLVSKDYDVIPVNNKEVEIEGRKVFKTVLEISVGSTHVVKAVFSFGMVPTVIGPCSSCK